MCAMRGNVQKIKTPTGVKLRQRPDKNVRPGDRVGLTDEQVQDLIRQSKRVKGQSYDLSVGSNENLSVQLPGTSYMLLGFVFAFSGANPPSGNAKLTINNEIVVDSSFVEFFGSDYTDEEYYFIPRPLSGQDDIKFSVNDVDLEYTLNVNYYYL